MSPDHDAAGGREDNLNIPMEVSGGQQRRKSRAAEDHASAYSRPLDEEKARRPPSRKILILSG